VHIEFLLEEASAEIVLTEILPKIVGDNVTLRFHDFRGKQNLLKHLPNRLKGYKSILQSNSDLKIVVLIDEDREDCTKLKQCLEDIAKDAGLLTRSISKNFQILNRIAVEELEAWFFGDVEAIRKAYPRVPESLSQNRNYRKPDEIKGGTCEALERVLSSKGYFTKGYMPKTEVARNIAPHLHPENNTSKSFQVFYDGLKLLIELAK
jgi:Domain of unknown function (DUF4276)